MKTHLLLALSLLTLISCATTGSKVASGAKVAPGAKDCVVLLHGLARTDASMAKLERTLAQNSYKPVNIGYPSRKYTIEELANTVLPPAIAECQDSISVNFVGHSMGGILVRQYLSEHEIRDLKHVVMLAPPNQGSELVDKLSTVPGFKALNGPAGLQMGTGEMSVPKKLGPVDYSVGVIAGTDTINLILSRMLPRPNDGKVSVESTKVDGMADHITVPVSHPYIMKDNGVIEQVLYFLKNGKFEQEVSAYEELTVN